jgi:hypothetical protein
MEVLALYNRIRAMYPKEVDISDGRHVNGGYYFPTLTSIWDDIEDRTDQENDEWGSLAAWAFAQAVHRKAKRLLRRGERTLDVDSITVASFDHWMKFNLAAEGYDKERIEYREL